MVGITDGTTFKIDGFNFVFEQKNGDKQKLSSFGVLVMLIFTCFILSLFLVAKIIDAMINFVYDVIVYVVKTIGNCIKFVVNAVVNLCSTMMYYIGMV
jgi:hypothetical protein